MQNIFRKHLLESLKLPDNNAIGQLPSIYICAPIAPDIMAKTGWEKQFQAGNTDGTTRANGQAFGEGTYSSLTLYGAEKCYRQGYGKYMYECKIRGGFNGFIFFNADDTNCKAIRKYCYDTYGYIASVEEQLKRYMTQEELNHVMRHYYNSIRGAGSLGSAQKHFYKYGIRGIVYDWNGGGWGTAHECVVPWDTTLVIPYRVSLDGGRTWKDIYTDDNKSVFSKKADMKMQFYNYPVHGSEAYSDVFDSVFAWVQKKNGKYNIIEADYDNYKPREVVPYDFDEVPTMYLNQMDDGNGNTTGGYFVGKINGVLVYCMPDGYWDEFQGDWVTWDEFPQFLQNYKASLQENISKSLKRNLREAFDEGLHNLRMPSKDEMLSDKVRIIYRCCHECDYVSIMEKGQLRQFAGENDGFWYGNGVYCNLELNGAISGSYNTETPATGKRHPDGFKYGSTILKCALLGGFSRFLIFDEPLAKRFYGDHYQLKDQVYALLPKQQADELWYKMQNFMKNDSNYGVTSRRHFQDMTKSDTAWHITTGMPHRLFPNKGKGPEDKAFYALCQEFDIRGIVYHGGNDGFSCVVYNYDECIPVAYSLDHGKTFKTDKYNHDNVINRNIFDNDPIMKFEYKFKELRYPIGYTSAFDGHKTGISVVQFKNGSWNYLDIQTGETILPFRLEEEPSPISSEDGQFVVKYKGELVYGCPDGYWDTNEESWMTWDEFKA